MKTVQIKSNVHFNQIEKNLTYLVSIKQDEQKKNLVVFIDTKFVMDWELFRASQDRSSIKVIHEEFQPILCEYNGNHYSSEKLNLKMISKINQVWKIWFPIKEDFFKSIYSEGILLSVKIPKPGILDLFRSSPCPIPKFCLHLFISEKDIVNTE